jgi:nitrous oxidase accessory protein
MKIDIIKILLMAVLLISGSSSYCAKVLEVGHSRHFNNLREALNSAADGDTVIVYGGIYHGNFVINKSITLIGKDNPVLDADNHGTILTINAPDVIVSGATLQNSGILLDKEDTGILAAADNIIIKENHLKEVLFGVYLRKSDGSIVKDNIIEGRSELDIPRRGDLFRGWYSKNILVEGNKFKFGRDVILWFSGNSKVIGNFMSGARYGLHFMYNTDCEVIRNTMTDNSVGMYMMYSKNLVIKNNLVAYNRGTSGFGIGFKDLDNVDLSDNVIADNRVGLFVDNSPRQIDSYMKYDRNVIAYNESGLEELTSITNSYFTGNSFIENYNQTHLSNTQNPDNDYWKNNYWGDYSGYDKNGDGNGDLPYKSEELVENLLDDQPNLRIFLYSPAINALNYASRAFPILQPEHRLIDKTPETKPVMPDNIPVMKMNKETGFIIFSAIITLLSLTLILTFIFRNRLSYNLSKATVIKHQL